MAKLIFNLSVFIFLSALFWIWLTGFIRARIVRREQVYSSAREEEERLTADFAMLEAETARLKHDLDETLEFYEITSEISKFLEEDKVFSVFNEKIRKYLSLQDCRFVKPSENIPDDGLAWMAFPLEIGKRMLGRLEVRGIKEKDVDKFHILAQQFLLGLKRAVLYQHVQELATMDGLTRVFTRRHWTERCNEEIERSGKFGYNLSCLMIDVDKFKDFNDTYGHLVGDAILVSVARIIKDNIRQIDLLGKYGGEEFCVILTETDMQGAQFVAERIRQAMQDNSIQAYDELLRVTISIGIAGFPADSRELSGLVDKADQALYKAKQTGRNKVCVYSA